MPKTEKREQQRFKQKHRPKGNPKFLILLIEEWEKRRQELINRGGKHGRK